MTYQIPTAKKSKDQDKFQFHTADGELHSLPLIQHLKPRDTISISGSNGLAPVATIIDKYAPGVIDTLDDATQLNALIEAWTAESKVSLGE